MGYCILHSIPYPSFHDADLNSVFTTPWQKLISATETIANAHHTYARNIETEVEKPLRSFVTSSRVVANMENILGNIQTIAKDVDNATKRAEKLKEKGGKAAADKVASAATEVEDAQGQWDSQAPYVFERLQEIDELRLELIQKCLTQFHTYTDEVEKFSSASVEQCLNSILNVQLADEIQQFALKGPSSVPTLRERRGSRPQPPPTIPETSTLQPPALPRGDTDSQRSASSKSVVNLPPGKILMPCSHSQRHSDSPSRKEIQQVWRRPQKTRNCDQRQKTQYTPIFTATAITREKALIHQFSLQIPNLWQEDKGID
jgi:hypothetical protein